MQGESSVPLDYNVNGMLNHINDFNSNSETVSGEGTVRNSQTSRIPYIKILEQPASKALRFRYLCEGRSAGSIPGVNNTAENKTYPKIQIVGFRGTAIIVVSCVTKDEPYRAHPHNIVGKEGCKNGIFTTKINNEDMTASFQNLGIQCVKKKHIEEALKLREEMRIDPFKQGFSHSTHPSSIDLNAVRLCFQAFLQGSERGKFNVLQPVVSEPIYDKKAMSDLVITKLSHCSASVRGGQDVILLCEKVIKEDIRIRFYEEDINHQIIWEGYGDFTPSQVHKQAAIWFKTPQYRTLEVDHSLKVKIELKRPSDGVTSEPLDFIFTPNEPGCPRPLKRTKRQYQENFNEQISATVSMFTLSPQPVPVFHPNPSRIPFPAIKDEPDASQPYVVPGTSSVPSCSLFDNLVPSPSEYPIVYPGVNVLTRDPSNQIATPNFENFDPYIKGSQYRYLAQAAENNTMVTGSFPSGSRPCEETSLEQKVDVDELLPTVCEVDSTLSENISKLLNITAHNNTMIDSLTKLVNDNNGCANNGY